MNTALKPDLKSLTIQTVKRIKYRNLYFTQIQFSVTTYLTLWKFRVEMSSVWAARRKNSEENNNNNNKKIMKYPKMNLNEATGAFNCGWTVRCCTKGAVVGWKLFDAIRHAGKAVTVHRKSGTGRATSTQEGQLCFTCSSTEKACRSWVTVPRCDWSDHFLLFPCHR